MRLVDGVAEYLFRDQLGSVRALTGADGARQSRRAYHPFGELHDLPDAAGLGAAPEDKGWIGERYDASAGLQYLNARYYDPRLGLFLQPDWYEVTEPGVGTNRYAYSFNDPVNGMDPGGNFCVPCVTGIVGGTVGGLAYVGRQWFVGEPVTPGGLSASVGAGAAIGSGAALLSAPAATAVGGGLTVAGGVEVATRASHYGELSEQGQRAVVADGVLVGLGAIGTVTQGARAAGAVRMSSAATTRVSVLDKLDRYLLNPDHPVGGAKAKWFDQALGFNRTNMRSLAEQIRFDPKSAIETATTEYGTKFNQVIPIQGANGKTIEVPFTWIKNTDNEIRLVTAVPQSK